MSFWRPQPSPAVSRPETITVQVGSATPYSPGALPAPRVLAPGLPLEGRTRYAALAQEIGWTCQALVDEEVREWFVAAEIPVFDADAVRAYMNRTVMKLNGGREAWDWYWHPLRPGARDEPWVTNAGEVPERSPVKYGYSLPIPERVLARIAQVDRGLGEKVAIQITVIARRPKADPFVAAVVKGTGTRYVFDVWDEPGFTG